MEVLKSILSNAGCPGITNSVIIYVSCIFSVFVLFAVVGKLYHVKGIEVFDDDSVSMLPYKLKKRGDKNLTKSATIPLIWVASHVNWYS